MIWYSCVTGSLSGQQGQVLSLTLLPAFWSLSSHWAVLSGLNRRGCTQTCYNLICQASVGNLPFSEEKLRRSEWEGVGEGTGKRGKEKTVRYKVNKLINKKKREVWGFLLLLLLFVCLAVWGSAFYLNLWLAWGSLCRPGWPQPHKRSTYICFPSWN